MIGPSPLCTMMMRVLHTPLTPAELLHGRRITSYNDKISRFTMNDSGVSESMDGWGCAILALEVVPKI